jgi:outer membrane protein OmpA-like peptidoglycan-associated protein
MKPLTGVVMVTVALIAVSACASKSWVEEELDRREARIIAATQDGAFPLGRPDGQAIQQRLGGIDQRIWALEGRTAQLHERVQSAALRAEMAAARAEGVDARLTRFWAHANARTVVNTLHVDFAFDQFALDVAAKSMLVVLVRELRGDPRLGLDLEGYTDSKGSREYNVQLSQKRIDAVQGYLLEQGVERHRLKATARGPLQNSMIPEERKRRVDIKLVVASD